ncbi:MAG: hypothetical protein KJ955_07285 [Nanoarchaeota archaeon]|nr:hypothetical protein [Nanoarchaeota archaeon]
MAKEELLKEFEAAFEKLRKELKLKHTLYDYDKVFFFTDIILKEDFVGIGLSRMLRSRIADLYMSWSGYLHGLIMPNPQSLIVMSESKLFDAKEKEEISYLISRLMAVSRMHTLLDVSNDKKMEGGFFETALVFWNTEFRQKAEAIMRKIHKYWAEEAARHSAKGQSS